MAGRTPITRTLDLDGPVSWVDHGGPDDGQVVVAVHGLGRSLDALPVLPAGTTAVGGPANQLAGAS